MASFKGGIGAVAAARAGLVEAHGVAFSTSHEAASQHRISGLYERRVSGEIPHAAFICTYEHAFAAA